jgi:hypothetical protein
MKFDRYGIHWVEGDIALLVQQNRVDHVLCINMDFDVTVKVRRQGLSCPHNIHLNDSAGFLPNDTLVGAMLPLPKTLGSPAIHVEDTTENRQLVQRLLRLSSTPVSGSMRPLWMGNDKWNADALSLTNISPLVLYGVTNDHMWLARKILDASLYLPRRLIFMGPPEVSVGGELQRVKPTLSSAEISSLPLEQIGAGILKQYMLEKPNEDRMD